LIIIDLSPEGKEAKQLTNRREFLRVHEVAGEYPFSIAFLRKLILRRSLPFHKVGRAVWLKRGDLESLIAAGRVEATTRGRR
jgi:hypothetical protein